MIIINNISSRLAVLRADMWSGWRLSTSCLKSTKGPTLTEQRARPSPRRLPPPALSPCRRVTTPTIIVKRASLAVRQRRSSAETPPRATPSNPPETTDSPVEYVEQIPKRSERTQQTTQSQLKEKDGLKLVLISSPNIRTPIFSNTPYKEIIPRLVLHPFWLKIVLLTSDLKIKTNCDIFKVVWSKI